MSKSNYMPEGSAQRADFERFKYLKQKKIDQPHTPVQAVKPPSPWELQHHKDMIKREQDKLDEIKRKKTEEVYGPSPEWMD